MKKVILSLVLILCCHLAISQVIIRGSVKSGKEGMPGALVYLKETNYQAITNARGNYEMVGVPAGNYRMVVFFTGFGTIQEEIEVRADQAILKKDFQLEELSQELENVTIQDERVNTFGVRRLNAIEGSNIFEGKKNEVIELKDLALNLATNNSRQTYNKVPGLNIYENDGAGLQLGIGARGLDPNRTSHFNVRQNGYDISADALGYPESYYTPSLEGVERIEVVRGAASLQYGTQFGGLLNFQMKKGNPEKKAEVTLRNTVGSFGFFNTFSSLGGQVGKFNHYTFFQYKRGNGWRPNSGFDSKVAYTSLTFEANENLSITGQYTYMDYLAQQPGGLTDALFEENARQSIRERNWFQVNWNLFSLLVDYKLSAKLRFNWRNFGLIGGRDALGNLGRIDRVDTDDERNLFVDDFKNFGSEARLIYNYQIGKQEQALLIGTRYYQGLTLRKQGLGQAGKEADFRFLNPGDLEDSDYEFPGRNVALFAENVFNVGPNFSITPGLRYEMIRTQAEGYYTQTTKELDPQTGFAVDSTFQVNESRIRDRSFLFGGIGLSYKGIPNQEIYANFSQNYRSINFNDIRVNNPNLVVDENIQDESGYNFDLGIRGNKADLFNYDVSLFYLRYNDRIGAVLKTDSENFRIFRFRTNVADAYSAGMEAFGEVNLIKALGYDKKYKLSVFSNISLIQARYINSGESGVEGNQLELVPPVMIKPGFSFSREKFRMSFQYNYVQQHFTDATNAVKTPSAVEGIIPSYQVMDLTFQYQIKRLKIETSVNNLSDERYFTRRAAGYPGPGIIPADGRSFFVGLEYVF
ncbi:TonB-dependent receptor [Algoriphagus sp. NBT04N3]|uniref:TonB-dependent receptor n=1 Tax=Algoriphagus sp. NBT04N3 TaxID=2705473 RepID=UPI001C632C89|nr:TonB-dependent receptor [Algoriphagus sp. NBT04N3]QYH39656.1 TonB-dependent receptor [Algoriphagus sp. NBT04N3]